MPSSEIEPAAPSDEVLHNPITGEVEDEDSIGDVGLEVDLANIDEHQIVQQMPTPAQVQYALGQARTRVGRMPLLLKKSKDKLRAAERNYRLVYGGVFLNQEGRESDRRQKALLDPDVVRAQDELDIAKIALDWAMDLEKALSRDVRILQSVNANLRAEVGTYHR